MGRARCKGAIAAGRPVRGGHRAAPSRPAAAPEGGPGVRGVPGHVGRTSPGHAERNVTGPRRRGSGGSAASRPARPGPAKPRLRTGTGGRPRRVPGRRAAGSRPVSLPRSRQLGPRGHGPCPPAFLPPPPPPGSRPAGLSSTAAAPGTGAAPRGQKARKPPRSTSCASGGDQDRVRPSPVRGWGRTGCRWRLPRITARP